MRFYRLEKTNYFKVWSFAVIKSLFISMILIIALMLCMGYKFMIVVSGSMEPIMPVGSLVLVTPCEYEDLELGDIVTMNNNGLVLTHRVAGKIVYENSKQVYIDKDNPRVHEVYGEWYTKGDNSDTIDGAIMGDVVGTISENHIFELTGDIVRYIKSNYIVVIIFAIIFIVFYETLNYLKGKMIKDDIETYEWEEE